MSQALEVVLNSTDTYPCVTALAHLWPNLPQSEQRTALLEILKRLEAVPETEDWGRAWSSCVPLLSGANAQDVLSTVRKLNDPARRAVSLRSILPHLSDQELSAPSPDVIHFPIAPRRQPLSYINLSAYASETNCVVVENLENKTYIKV